MVRRALVVLCLSLMTLLLASCGQTYELQSITVAGTQGGTDSSFNIEGIGNSQSVVVTANYSNGKTDNVTIHSNYSIGASEDPSAPLTAVEVNQSGVLKAIDAACTWSYTFPNGSTTASYTTQPYPVTITYSGHTATAFLSVDSAGGCYDGIGFPAPPPASAGTEHAAAAESARAR